jgi:hypothetical protein
MNDNQTAITATSTATASSTPTPSPRGGGRRLRHILLALVLAAAATVGLGVSQASAWTSPSFGGSYGYVTPRGVQGVGVYYRLPGALYGSMVPAINVTGPLVTRSTGSTGVQRIEYRFVLWQFVNNQWINVYSSWTQIRDVAPGSSADFSPEAVRVARGYYRATFSVVWKDQYLRPLGSRNFDYAHASDYSCFVAGCVVGQGWILN